MADKEKKKTKKISNRRKKALQERQSIEKKAAIATGVVFLGLLVSFMFIALKSPVPEPQQRGIDVVMGEHNLGMNKKSEVVKKPTEEKGQSEEPQSKEAKEAEKSQTSESPETKVEEPTKQKSETQEKVPAPKASDKAKKVEKKKKESKEAGEEKGDKPDDKETTQKEEKKPNPKNLYTPSQNQGDDEKTGNKGDKKGKKSSESFEKKGKSLEGNNPISNLNLEGRAVTKFPKIKEQTQKQGKVVVQITVNKNGEVVKAVPGKRHTTVTSLRLKKIAKKAALNTQFDKIKNGPNQQVGTMTINFKLQ